MNNTFDIKAFALLIVTVFVPTVVVRIPIAEKDIFAYYRIFNLVYINIKLINISFIKCASTCNKNHRTFHSCSKAITNAF